MTEHIEHTEHKEDSVVFIGKKPFMNYVTGVVMQFNSGIKKVTVKARGKYISRAVDVAEVVRNRFLTGIKIDDIKINSEEFDGEEGRKIRISTIEVTLGKA
jgi:DNA-binding protein